MSKKVTKKKTTKKDVKKKTNKTAKAKKKTLKANKPVKRTEKKTTKKEKQNSKKPKTKAKVEKKTTKKVITKKPVKKEKKYAEKVAKNGVCGKFGNTKGYQKYQEDIKDEKGNVIGNVEAERKEVEGKVVSTLKAVAEKKSEDSFESMSYSETVVEDSPAGDTGEAENEENTIDGEFKEI